MTEVDKKNNEIILDIYSKLSLAPKSLDFVKSWFNSPDIDPIYAKHLGPDLRKRWKLDYATLVREKIIEDKAFTYFNNFFFCYQQSSLSNPSSGYPNIKEANFNDNKVLYKKNQVKLKKVLTDFYNEHRDLIFGDWARNKVSLGLPSKLKADFNEDTSLIEQYILKANEVIGKYKISSKESTTELVMSNNPADWFMCSTSENWSSCLGLESQHGYWIGVPFILDDKNRTMFYVTSEKRKKEHLGIKVDGFNNRTWGLLNNNEKINVVRWFPNTFLNVEGMKRITELPIEGEGRYNFDRSKYYILSNIKFEDGVAHTPYLDGIGISVDKISGSVYYDKNGNSGFNTVNIDKGAKKTHITNKGVAKFLASERTYLKYLYTKICTSCNKDIEPMTEFNYDGCHYCAECRSRLFGNCDHCGNDIPNGELISKDEKRYCRSCFKEMYEECAVCSNVFSRTVMQKHICPSCMKSDKVVKCAECGEITIVDRGIRLHSEREGFSVVCSTACSQDYRESIKKYNKVKYFKCTGCNNWHDERDAEVLIDGSLICKKDLFKIYDKRQLKLSFKV